MIKYFVNEAKGTVVAKMENSVDEHGNEMSLVEEVVDYAVAQICRIFRGQNYDGVKGFVAEDCFRYVARRVAEKHFSEPVIGKAKCCFAEGEEFDEEFGKELAKSRCLSQYYFRLTNMMEDMFDIFGMASNNLAWRRDMAYDNIDKWFDIEEQLMEKSYSVTKGE